MTMQPRELRISVKGRLQSVKRTSHLGLSFWTDLQGMAALRSDVREQAMNIYGLGTLYVSGDRNPRYGARKKE